MGEDKTEHYYCSFCEKHQDETEFILVGNTSNICSDCVQLCFDIIQEKRMVKRQDVTFGRQKD